MPDSLADTQAAIREFRDERDWKQFHTLKNIMTAMGIEVAELQELFLWVPEKDAEEFAKKNIEAISDEVADVANALLLLTDMLGIDLIEAMRRKRDKNALKYPVAKAKGRADKYTAYQDDTGSGE